MIRDLATHHLKFVTVPDLAQYLHVPRSTIYWHIQYGKLPYRRFGRRTVRIETVEARQWAELYGGWSPPSTTAAVVSPTLPSYSA